MEDNWWSEVTLLSKADYNLSIGCESKKNKPFFFFFILNLKSDWNDCTKLKNQNYTERGEY